MYLLMAASRVTLAELLPAVLPSAGSGPGRRLTRDTQPAHTT